MTNHVLLDHVDGKTLVDPRVIRFATGRRKKQWVKNCVSTWLVVRMRQ